MRRHDHGNEKGAALMTVLLMVTVLSTIAVAMLDDMRFAIRRQANIDTAAQAEWYMLGTEGLAKEVLVKSWQASPGRARLSDPWARAGLRFPVEGGMITGQIADASNCFNVNSLVEHRGQGGYQRRDAGVAAYQALLAALDFDEAESALLADALADWIDSDNNPAGQGAEDYHYSGLKPPYRAANRLMADLSELRAVRGYQPDIYQTVRPHLCAHPDTSPSPLNINTLNAGDAPLLAMALGGDVTLSMARDLILTRPEDGYVSIQAFLGQQLLAGVAVAPDAAAGLALSTRYYLLSAEVRYHEAYRRMASLFRIDGAGQVILISRQWGAAA